MEKVVISGKPKSIEMVKVVKIETEIEDDSILMPKRTIIEFWTLDKQYIGRIDPLDFYLELEQAVKESASSKTNLKEININVGFVKSEQEK